MLEKLLIINSNSYTCFDDVAISTHMTNQGIRMANFDILSNYKMNFQILNENESDINAHTHENNHLEINDTTYIDDILYFRVKNAKIEQDLIVTQKILKKIYNIEL